MPEDYVYVSIAQQRQARFLYHKLTPRERVNINLNMLLANPKHV